MIDMEDNTFDLGSADPHMPLENLKKLGKSGAAGTLAIEDRQDGTDPMSTAISKVSQAWGNLNKLKMKVLQITSASKGAKHDEFVNVGIVSPCKRRVT